MPTLSDVLFPASSFLEIFSGTQEVMYSVFPATTVICLMHTEEELCS